MKNNFNLLKKLRWLYPGIKVKRWILLSASGIILIVLGAVKFDRDIGSLDKTLDILLIIAGIVLIFMGTRRVIRSFLSIFLPYRDQDLVDIVYKKRFLDRGPKIVVVGGGHGLFSLLTGLKEYTSNITAIVTVADSGGSSGRLRQEFDMVPPGDIRNCLVALSATPALMGQLFQFRFKQDSELKGHNFGNLFIAAMTQLTGDFDKAIEESSKVLAIQGQVVPSTLNKINLVAEYTDGSSTEGEADIPERHIPIKRVYLKLTRPSTEAEIVIKPNPTALRAIQEADIIVIGPGSLYTSILPNLLIKEIPEAIAIAQALKIYVCNVMTQHGETDGYSAKDHIKTLLQHTNPRLFEYCIVNIAHPPEELLSKYRNENSFPVLADALEIKKLGYQAVGGDVISAIDFVRHDPQKLAKLIMDTFRKEAIRKEISEV